MPFFFPPPFGLIVCIFTSSHPPNFLKREAKNKENIPEFTTYLGLYLYTSAIPSTYTQSN